MSCWYELIYVSIYIYIVFSYNIFYLCISFIFSSCILYWYRGSLNFLNFAFQINFSTQSFTNFAVHRQCKHWLETKSRISLKYIINELVSTHYFSMFVESLEVDIIIDWLNGKTSYLWIDLTYENMRKYPKELCHKNSKSYRTSFHVISTQI